MPIVETTPYSSPYLVYNAPLDEKTKKIREQFKVDETTGYPEHYNWRPMARLGRTYMPEDPFLKFDPYDPEENIASKWTYVGFGIIAAVAGHGIKSYIFGRPLWARSYTLVLTAVGMSSLFWWAHGKSEERQGIKNAITMDYARKHPERFGPIFRPKIREILFERAPAR